MLGASRADNAQAVRVAAASFQRNIALPAHPDNGDEARYPDRSASYGKALIHNDQGDVDLPQYNQLLTALRSGKDSDVELLALPGPRKLVDPLAAYAYQLEGADSHALAIPPAPTFTSDQVQGEMAELYWMALARDIPFDSYAVDGSAIINAAIGDLNGFRDVRGPRISGPLTPQTLFRDGLPDSLTGNFISQYLLQNVPYGPQQILQTSRQRPAGEDHLTTYPEWLAIQRGGATSSLQSTTYRYLRNGRDLTEWVHADFPAQACLNAALIIAGQGNQGDAKVSPGIQDPNNPYRPVGGYAKQSAFVTFGNQAFFDLVTRVMQDALQAAWYQKWLVHRRLRPEEYGGRVHGTLALGRGYPVGDQLRASLLDPARLGRVSNRWAGYLLPTAFAEGSPAHPAYPSGHSTYVSAGVTMIKAFVDGTLPVSAQKRVADPNNGDTLTDINTALTINGELDKLVMNVGVGRLFAGVHWRSDHTYGVRLGELVAIRALQDLARNYAESFAGWQLRRFDGSTVVVTSTSVTQNGSPIVLSNNVT